MITLKKPSHLQTASKAAEFVTLEKGMNTNARLVCFHFAGGSAQSFLSWREKAAKTCELLAAELPGRGRRYSERFLTSIPEAAETFADAYEKLPVKPSAFYGHSLGALLAYETARILVERGAEGPCKLIISSRSSPIAFPVSIGLPELSDTSLMKYLRNLQGTSTSILENKMLMDMMLPIIRADLEIIYDYKCANLPVLTIPIEVIGAIDDHHCPFESLLDWRQITNGSFRLQMIEGGHFAPIAKPEITLESLKNLSDKEGDDVDE